MAELDWTEPGAGCTRSVFDPVACRQSRLQPADVTTTRWRNTLFGSLGLEYRASRTSGASRAGAAYDQSPVSDATRETRIPDADRVWLSAGSCVIAPATIWI